MFGAWSLLEQKEYAVKKLVVEGRLKMGELMNEVAVIGQQHHPNIVQYYHCWLELATLDEALEYSSMLESKISQQSIC